ncbi:MAG: hypothetical protein J7M26_06705, partial [Armatimonadetes bacterium]|nr:hypothetical protein [Armatimonadota bacterium]
FKGRSTNDPVTFAEWSYALQPGPHTVTIEVKGAKQPLITVLVDGKKVGQATDKDVLGVGPVPAGGIILAPRRWSKSKGNTVMKVRRIRVQPLP